MEVEMVAMEVGNEENEEGQKDEEVELEGKEEKGKEQLEVVEAPAKKAKVSAGASSPLTLSAHSLCPVGNEEVGNEVKEDMHRV